MAVLLSMMGALTRQHNGLHMPRFRLIAAASLMTLALTGCSKVYVPSFVKVYQPDIEQGNVLEPDQVAKLHVGMPRSQVHQILGTPALKDIFHDKQQETYVFYDKPGKHEVFQHNLMLTYNPDGTLAKIEQSGAPLDKAPGNDMPETTSKKAKTKDADKAPPTKDKDLYSLTPPGDKSKETLPEPGSP